MRFNDIVTFVTLIEGYTEAERAFADEADPTEVQTAIAQYKQLVASKKIKGKNANIDTWRPLGWTAFHNAVARLTDQPTHPGGRCIVLEESDKWLVIIPLDKKATCFDGTQSNWCGPTPIVSQKSGYSVTIPIRCLRLGTPQSFAFEVSDLNEHAYDFTDNVNSIDRSTFIAKTGLDPDKIATLAVRASETATYKTHLKQHYSNQNLIASARHHNNRNDELENALFDHGSVEQIVNYCIQRKVRIPVGERRMLAIARRDLSAIGKIAVYARQVIKEGWPEFNAAVTDLLESPVIKLNEWVDHLVPYISTFYPKGDRWLVSAFERKLTSDTLGEYFNSYSIERLLNDWDPKYKAQAKQSASTALIAQPSEDLAYAHLSMFSVDVAPEVMSIYAKYWITVIEVASITSMAFPEGEPTVAKQPKSRVEIYLQYTNTTLDPTLEARVSSDAELAYYFACNNIQGRYPAGEQAIAGNPKYALMYAMNVLETTWLKATGNQAVDNAILSGPGKRKYATWIKTLGPKSRLDQIKDYANYLKVEVAKLYGPTTVKLTKAKQMYEDQTNYAIVYTPHKITAPARDVYTQMETLINQVTELDGAEVSVGEIRPDPTDKTKLKQIIIRIAYQDYVAMY